MDEIASMCRERGVPLIVDASQSAGSVGIKMEAWGAAFVAMPGHKGLYGPQGTGLLLCGEAGTPILYGGTGSESALSSMPDFLPDRLEAGTHNMPGIAGLLAGLKYVESTGQERILAHEQSLVRYAADRLGRTGGITVYRAEGPSLQAGVLSFNIDGMQPEEAGELFAQSGIAVRAGLHCSPAAHRSLGILPGGTVRASVSAFSTRSDVDALIRAAGRLEKNGRRVQ